MLIAARVLPQPPSAIATQSTSQRIDAISRSVTQQTSRQTRLHERTALATLVRAVWWSAIAAICRRVTFWVMNVTVCAASGEVAVEPYRSGSASDQTTESRSYADSVLGMIKV